jgi:hypothetical protein
MFKRSSLKMALPVIQQFITVFVMTACSSNGDHDLLIEYDRKHGALLTASVAEAMENNTQDLFELLSAELNISQEVFDDFIRRIKSVSSRDTLKVLVHGREKSDDNTVVFLNESRARLYVDYVGDDGPEDWIVLDLFVQNDQVHITNIVYNFTGGFQYSLQKFVSDGMPMI